MEREYDKYLTEIYSSEVVHSFINVTSNYVHCRMQYEKIGTHFKISLFD